MILKTQAKCQKLPLSAASCKVRVKQKAQKKMGEAGFPPEKRKRLKELKGSLSGKGTGKSPNRKRLQEFQKLMKARSQARQKAMQDPAIRKAREALREDLMAAMQKADPKAPELLKRLRESAQKARRLHRQAGWSGGARAGQRGQLMRPAPDRLSTQAGAPAP